MIDRTHHIGVIGLAQSGKTTFITSLLDHWSNHQPDKFPLGKVPKNHSLMVEWNGDDEANGKHRFQINRKLICSGEWPHKSLQSESYSLRLSCTSWHRSLPVMLYDIPGERLADAEMLQHSCLSQWSKAIIHSFESDTALAEHTTDFVQVFRNTKESSEANLKQLEECYRMLMARFQSTGVPLISPSSMLVDEKGNYVPDECLDIPEQTEKWFLHASPLGLRGKPVIPLPMCFKSAADQLWKERQKNYVDYRNNVVRPALSPLGNCHDIVFLVDIAGIFSEGVGWKNQASALIESFIEGISAKGHLEKWLRKSAHYGALGLIRPQVSRIKFVATQADRIHKDDRPKVRQLLKDLTRTAIRIPETKGFLSIDYKVAAAVDSTESLPSHHLSYLDENDGHGSRHAVSELPEEFPDCWSRQDYLFPKTAPRMPVNKGNPPKQFGLDSITEELFDIKK